MLLDEKNNELAISKTAAATGIAAVVASRIAMAAPGMGTLTFSKKKIKKAITLQQKLFFIFLQC